MEMFNVHRRDILNFDSYMDLKKPGFGGPASAKQYRDGKGKKVNDNPKLDGYQHTVERDPAFSHPVYDPTYKAMTHDLVYKQEKKKPFTYQDPYLTAIPVTLTQTNAMKENRAFQSFSEFLNESMESSNEERIPVRNFDMAEDVLFDKKMDWDGFGDAPRGIKGKAFTKDGDIIAYFDEDARELVILPGSETMSDDRFDKMMNPDNGYEGLEDEEEFEEPREEEEEEFEEPREEEEEEYEEPQEMGSESSDLKSIEKLLKSFEDEPEESEEELED